MKHLIGACLGLALGLMIAVPTFAQEDKACHAVGDMIPGIKLPVDWGRVPKIELDGVNAVAFVEALGATKEEAAEINHISILYAAPPNAELAAMDFRIVIVYVKGCALGAFPIKGEVVKRILEEA